MRTQFQMQKTTSQATLAIQNRKTLFTRDQQLSKQIRRNRDMKHAAIKLSLREASLRQAVFKTFNGN